jgi:hypothetical protein
MGGGFLWGIANDDGQHIVEVSFQEEEGQRWSWYVPPDDDWQYRHWPNPCGLGRRSEAICEVTLKGTYLKA